MGVVTPMALAETVQDWTSFDKLRMRVGDRDESWGLDRLMVRVGRLLWRGFAPIPRGGIQAAYGLYQRLLKNMRGSWESIRNIS